jgi:transcriptional regulator with XRE-family HTH domain
MTLLLREAIGDSLRRARTERRATLRQVAGRARVSLGYLSEVERGRKEPSSELLAAICDALDFPLSELLVEAADSLRPQPAVALPAVPIGTRHADLRRAPAPLRRDGAPASASGLVGVAA